MTEIRNPQDARDVNGPGPLAGIVVVELDDGLAQYTGKLLTDLGATVIKVEPPSGAAQRLAPPFYTASDGAEHSIPFMYYNTSKKSVVLDLTTEEGRGRLEQLIGRADLLLDGLGHRRLEGLGFSDARLAELGPELTYVSITPFGRTGPWADFAASDLVSMALGGVTAQTGYNSVDGAPGEPITPTGGHALQFAGVLAATIATAALQDPAKTFHSIDVSVHDCVTASTEIPLSMWEFGVLEAHRHTGEHGSANELPQRWQFQCSDGGYVCAMTNYMHNKRFGGLLDWYDSVGFEHDLRGPKFATEKSRNANMPLIVDTIEEFCRQHSSDYIYEEAQKRLLPWSKIMAPSEMLADDQLAARDFFVPVTLNSGDTLPFPAGPFVGLGSGLRGSDQRRVRPPLLGEDTDTVLAASHGRVG